MDINWPIVLFGNLVMDSAIAMFAILSRLEAKYRKIADDITSGVFLGERISDMKREIEKGKKDLLKA